MISEEIPELLVFEFCFVLRSGVKIDAPRTTVKCTAFRVAAFRRFFPGFEDFCFEKIFLDGGDFDQCRFAGQHTRHKDHFAAVAAGKTIAAKDGFFDFYCNTGTAFHRVLPLSLMILPII